MKNVDQQKSKNVKDLKKKVIGDTVGFLGIPFMIILFGDFDIRISVFCMAAIGLGMLSSYIVYCDTRSFYENE